jgi:hypothetical protein
MVCIQHLEILYNVYILFMAILTPSKHMIYALVLGREQVKFWTLTTFAHGVQIMCYLVRWVILILQRRNIMKLIVPITVCFLGPRTIDSDYWTMCGVMLENLVGFRLVLLWFTIWSYTLLYNYYFAMIFFYQVNFFMFLDIYIHIYYLFYFIDVKNDVIVEHYSNASLPFG